MEEQAVYDLIDFERRAYTPVLFENSDRGAQGDPANAEAATSQPSTFVCPSARRARPVTDQKDYVINGGNWTGAERRQTSGTHSGSHISRQGMAYMNSSVRISDVADGVSNTFLFLEKAHSISHSRCEERVGCNPFFYVTHQQQGYGVGRWPMNSTLGSLKGVASDHAGGCNVTMVDGAVRFVSEDIDFRLWQALFTRDGEEVIGQF